MPSQILNTSLRHFTSLATLILTALSLQAADPISAESDEIWSPLFNGENLDGWTVKIAKHPLGENFGDTFRVEDGILKVDYDQYEEFDMKFAHLYTNNIYSRYVFQLEYRFTGKAAAGAPHWAQLNSGVMIHCQSPLSFRQTQAFPVSMEFQLLAEGATAGTQTGNVCTPGTNLELNGQFNTDHIINSNSTLSPLNEWVSLEIEVRGSEEVIHRINGVEVLRYKHPQLDPNDRDGQTLLAAGAPLLLSNGHISLQAESQPIWFRNIRIRPLE